MAQHVRRTGHAVDSRRDHRDGEIGGERISDEICAGLSLRTRRARVVRYDQHPHPFHFHFHFHFFFFAGFVRLLRRLFLKLRQSAQRRNRRHHTSGQSVFEQKGQAIR